MLDTRLRVSELVAAALLGAAVFLADGVFEPLLVRGEPAALDVEVAFLQRRAARIKLLPEPPTPPRVEAPTNNPIDQFIVAQWQQAKLPSLESPPSLCNDATFCRRVYLDIIGVIPTIEELTRFLDAPSSGRRAELIDELLARDEDYAAHWTTFWEDAIASCPHSSFGSVLARGDYFDWIVENLIKNEQYDVMVAELIDPLMPGFKEPTLQPILEVENKLSFLRNRSHKEVLQTAADVGQVFLGTSMKCASCHDHFQNKAWPQDRFLGFASYFAQGPLEKIRCEESLGEEVAATWPLDQPDSDGPALPERDDRLHRAAELLTDPMSPRFAATMVNRLWHRYLGAGLIEPIDDYRSDVPPSHPELLEWLTHDFVQHNFDVKHTTRLILGSRTYQLAYNAELADVVSLGEPGAPRYFQSPRARRMTAEQLIDSIQVAVSQQLEDTNRVYRRHHKKSNPLTLALGRDEARAEVCTARSEAPSIVQALEVLNGKSFNTLVAWGELVDQCTASDDLEAVIDRIYLATMSRTAAEAEFSLGTAFLEATREELQQKTRDPRPEIVFEDFEGNQLKDWQTTGTAFSDQPRQRPLPPYLASTEIVGEGFLHSQSASETYVSEIDKPVGTLRSRVFQIERDYIQLLVWGGSYQGKTCVNLIVDGEFVASVLGEHDLLARKNQFDVRAFVGKQAQIEVVDQYGPGLGFIGVDHIVFTDFPIAVGTNPPAESVTIVDMLWALFASPAFQYIH